MKVLSRICAARGDKVTGSDITLEGHNADNVKNAEQVVYTSAVGEDNVEVAFARARKIKVTERATFLGEVAKDYRHVISIAGTHGKTTTTGMIGAMFLPLNPTVHIGGKVNGESGHIGGKEYFITEACEYRRSFLHLNSDLGVILNIELDHTDYYKDLSDIGYAFNEYANKCRFMVINGDDPHCRRLALSRKCMTFGLSGHNFVRAENVVMTKENTTFDVYKSRQKLGQVSLKVRGEHNVMNALAAICVGLYYNLSFSDMSNRLEKFSGIERRFEKLGELCGADIFTDYAHHPREIESTIKAARNMGYEKLTIVFEPHTYSRLKSLSTAFSQALSLADDIVVAPVFAAREAPIEGVTANVLARKLIDSGKKARHFDTYWGIIDYVKSTAKPHQVVIFMGAGSIDKAAKLLLRT